MVCITKTNNNTLEYILFLLAHSCYSLTPYTPTHTHTHTHSLTHSLTYTHAQSHYQSCEEVPVDCDYCSKHLSSRKQVCFHQQLFVYALSTNMVLIIFCWTNKIDYTLSVCSLKVIWSQSAQSTRSVVL